MMTIVQAYQKIGRPRLNLSDWLASLPASERDALYAATRARTAQWYTADRLARMSSLAALVAANDAPAQADVLRSVADEVRGLRDDLAQRSQAPTTQPRRQPQYTPQPAKPAPKPSGVQIPAVE
jgi:hypothetical protein